MTSQHNVPSNVSGSIPPSASIAEPTITSSTQPSVSNGPHTVAYGMVMDPASEKVPVGAVEISMKHAFLNKTLTFISQCSRASCSCLFVQFNGRIERYSWSDIVSLLHSVYGTITRSNPTITSVVYFTPMRPSFFADSHIQTLFYDDEVPEFLSGIFEGRSKLSMPPLVLRKLTFPVDSESLNEFHSATKDGSLFSQQHVFVGGTFDRLHNGHRLLLQSAAYATCGKLTVGVTSDDIITHKSNSHLIQSFEQRYASVHAFLLDVASNIVFEVRELLDSAGPALLAPEGLLVVTDDTLENGNKINERRKERGLKPLEIAVIDTLSIPDGRTLSSSMLRESDSTSVD
ncbi:hypothetical protein P9112_002272 [Eukaryota sp. TZLM1-RC]